VYDIWDKKENSRGQQRLSLPQRPERAGTRLILGAPDVIASQADVLPAERGDVAEQVLLDCPPLPAQFPIGGFQIPRVPEVMAATSRLSPEARKNWLGSGTRKCSLRTLRPLGFLLGREGWTRFLRRLVVIEHDKSAEQGRSVVFAAT
jgi:hypothetical protein